MELEQLLGAQQPAQQKQRLTSWQKYRGACKLIALAGGTCLLTQVARLVPGLAAIISILMGGGVLGLLAWAYFTEGDQRLEIALVVIAGVIGIALGIRDAVELLSLIGSQVWLSVGLISAIAIAVIISEGRSRGR